MLRYFLAGLALLAGTSAPAAMFPRASFPPTMFNGEVVRVKDGDSLMVRRFDVKRVSEVRLAGIDAPELAQPGGVQARSALRQMVQGRSIRVQVTDRDRYGRLVARVWQDRRYVNAAMTEAGQAWAFSRYLPDRDIRAGQDAARAAGRGLWRLPPAQRVPPATWRDAHPRED